MNRKEIKAKAKELVKGKHYWTLVGSYVVDGAIVGVASEVALLPGLFVSGPMGVGFANVYKGVLRDDEAHFPKLFSGFKRFWPHAVASLLEYIYVFLWSLLLVIPGLIKSYAYSMSYYLMADDENLGGNDAITKSKELMKGHKWDLFVLHLSFIGWILLSMLTCGILTVFYVGPYMQMAQLIWYEENIKQKEEPAQEVVAEQAE